MEFNITFLFEIITISIILPYLNFSVFQPLSVLSDEREKQTSGRKLEIDKIMAEINKQKAYIKEQMDMKISELHDSQKKIQALWASERKKQIESERLACQKKYNEVLKQLQYELKEASENLGSKKRLLANMICDKLHKR